MILLPLVALATAPMDSSLPPLLHHVYRIVCMGDSITAEQDSQRGYVSVMTRKLRELYPDQNFQVINVGIGGQKAPDMLARWDRDVIQKNPDLVTLSVGVNDVWHGFYDNHPQGDGPKGVDIDTYTVDVKKMIQSALDHNIKVVLVSPTVITEDKSKLENQKLGRYVDAEKGIAKSFKIPFVNLHDLFLARLNALSAGRTDNSLALTVDGVHMNPFGAKLMAYGILTGFGVPDASLSDLAPH